MGKHTNLVIAVCIIVTILIVSLLLYLVYALQKYLKAKKARSYKVLRTEDKQTLNFLFQAAATTPFSYSTKPCIVQLPVQEKDPVTKDLEAPKKEYDYDTSSSTTTLRGSSTVSTRDWKSESIDEDVFFDVFESNSNNEATPNLTKSMGSSSSLLLDNTSINITKIDRNQSHSKITKFNSASTPSINDSIVDQSINDSIVNQSKTPPRKRPLTRQKRITLEDLTDSCGSNDSINSLSKAPLRRPVVKKIQSESSIQFSPKLGGERPVVKKLVSDSAIQFSPKLGEGRRRRAGSLPFTSGRESIANIMTNIDGQIEFSVFLQDDRSLVVNIIRMKDVQILPMHFIGTLELYNKEEEQRMSKVCLVRDEEGCISLHSELPMGLMVHVTLLPTNKLQEHTSLVLDTHEPCFNEAFTVNDVSAKDIESGILCLQVVCVFGNSHEPIVLGEVKVKLRDAKLSLPLHFMKDIGTVTHELPLKMITGDNKDRGQLTVDLSYNPMTQHLTVKVVNARNLPKLGVSRKPSPLVKVALYHESIRVKADKTQIHKRCRNPNFEEAFHFEVSRDKVDDYELLLTVYHQGAMQRTTIGFVSIGGSAGTDAESHWHHAVKHFSGYEKTYKIEAKNLSKNR